MYYRFIILLLLSFALLAYVDTNSLKDYFYNKKIHHEYENTSDIIGIGIKENHGKMKVQDVILNTPADKAGIKVGDTLLDIDGIKIDSANTVKNYLHNVKKNKKIALTVEKPDNTVIEVKLVPISSEKLK